MPTYKPFSVGFRAEHLQTEIDKSLYHGAAGHPALPKGEYQLSQHVSGGRCVYTFCMCPGGTVCAAASEAGGVVTNGMSLHARDGRNANAAVVVSVDGSDFDNDPASAYAEVRRVIQVWLDHGIRIFRVDNPHTKPVSFWEELIATVHRKHPEVIFLAEAFTKPKMMQVLGKIGFSQSYTYFMLSACFPGKRGSFHTFDNLFNRIVN